MDFIKKTGLQFNVVPQTSSSGAVVLQVAGGHTDIGITDVTASRARSTPATEGARPPRANRLPNYPSVPTMKGWV
jgi:tripartite-type tricarboxylate transporter receptor subunit TctC